MIEPMNVRAFRSWLVAISVLCFPLLAHAQATWEDAPPDGPTQLEVDQSSGMTADAAGDAEAGANYSASSDVGYNDRDPRALTDFNAELKPYGYWRNDPTYGTVWVPYKRAVGKDFKPYVTNGHWAQAEDGEWIWVSNYPFGWVVFHYGRWVWVRGTGWAWIPGREYSHAWVVWRVPDPGVYYVGWAPMPPDYIWVNGVAVGVGFGVYTAWVFCPSRYAYSYHLHTHIVHDHHHVRYLGAHTHHYHAHGRPRYIGPRPKQARIPARAVPSKRVAANPKAVAASRPSGPSARRGFAGARRGPPRSSPRLRGVKSLGSTAAPAGRRRAPRAAPRGPTPTRNYRGVPPSRRSSVTPQRRYVPKSRNAAPQRRYVPKSRNAAPQRRYVPKSRTAPTQVKRTNVSPRAPQTRSAPRRSSPPSVRRAPPRTVQPYKPPTPKRRAPSRSGSRSRRR